MANKIARTLAFIVIAFRIVSCSRRSISTTSIVRLKCNGLDAEYQKCLGTYVLPNTLITTSICAEACQFAGNIPITQKFIHRHYKNYVKVDGVLLSNDIALLVTNATKRKIVHLSALDRVSPLGKKAFVPIMNEDNPKLQVAIIQRCIDSYHGLKGYYVCTNNIITQEMMKICQDKSEQGTPLLLDDKIYGIMSLRSKESCIIPQMKFTAIEPALPWISSITEVLDENFPMRMLREDEYVPPNNHLYFASKDDSTLHNESSEGIDQNETLYSNSGEEYNSTNEMEQLLAYFMTKKPLDPVQGKLDELKQVAQEVHILREGKPKTALTASTSMVTTIPPLRPFAATAIKFKPRLRTRARRSTTESETSTVSSTDATTHLIPFVMDLGNNKTTNIMDWFHNELKRMDEHPRYLILSTTTTTTAKPIFIDLT